MLITGLELFIGFIVSLTYQVKKQELTLFVASKEQIHSIRLRCIHCQAGVISLSKSDSIDMVSWHNYSEQTIRYVWKNDN